MGLDAFVFCDCYEKGRLREPPPGNVSVRVAEDGSLAREIDRNSLEDDLAWDRWQHCRACVHEGGVLLRHRLGNVSLIGNLRAELQRRPSHFPILLSKVIYSGSHGGDFLPVDSVPALRKELEALREFRCKIRESDDFMACFRDQMLQLVAASLSVNKPIVF